MSDYYTSSFDVMPGGPVLDNFQAGSIEERLLSSLGNASRSAAGVPVDAYRALGHPTIFHGVNMICGDMGQMEGRLRVRTGSDENERTRTDRNHFGGRVFARRTVQRNPLIPIESFRSTLTSHAILQGNGCAWIRRDNAGRPIELMPLLPYPHTYIEFDEDGELWYRTLIHDPDGAVSLALSINGSFNFTRRSIAPIDVFHIMGLGGDGLWGYGLVDVARDRIGYGLGIQEYGSRTMRNDARAHVVLSHPGKMDPASRENLRKEWKEIHGGDNVGTPAVLWQGMTLQQMSFNAEQSQMVESMGLDREMQADLLQIPKHRLNIGQRVPLDESNREYLQGPLAYWMAKWCQQAAIKLLTAAEYERGRDRIWFEFDARQFLKADMSTLLEKITGAVGGPWLDRDEGREIFGLDPARPDQTFLERSTGAPLGQAAPPEPSQSPLEDRVSRLLAAECQRLAQAENHKLLGAAEREKDLDDWLNKFYGYEWSGRIQEVLGPQAAVTYCGERLNQVRNIVNTGDAGALERDCQGKTERGRRMLNYALGGCYNGERMDGHTETSKE